MKNAAIENHIEAPKLDSVFGKRGPKPEDEFGKMMLVPLEMLHDFAGHPFSVRDDEAMLEMTESVKERGILVPGLARPRQDGSYDLVSGHRRKRASQLAGLTEMPVWVREIDDDSAVIIMVDSNIQREDILPSEKAKAYKMKMDALKRQGQRNDLTSRQVGEKFFSVEQIAVDAGESARQVHRFIRLNELEPTLLDMVDNGVMAFNPAVELSFLKPEEQAALADLLKCEERTPSLSQAQRLKKLSHQGELTETAMLSIIAEAKPQQKPQIVLKEDRIAKYFPEDYTPKQIEDIIIKLLESWHKRRQQEQQR